LLHFVCVQCIIGYGLSIHCIHFKFEVGKINREGAVTI